MTRSDAPALPAPSRPAPTSQTAPTHIIADISRGQRDLRAVGLPLLVLLVYVAVSTALFWQAWQAPTSQATGFYTDPQQFMWFLGWAAFAITHHHDLFVSTYANYPYGVNLLWNTSILLPGLVLTPITTLFGPVAAYNVLLTAALPLSGWCMYLALRRWVTSHAAAAVGGLLYGFSPYMTTQALAHPHLIVAVAPPLALLLLDELLVRQRRPALVIGALLGMLCAAQLLTAEEILFTTALVATVGVLLLAALYRGEVASRCRHAMAGLGAAAGVALALSAVPLRIQFAGPQRVPGVLHGGRPYATDLLHLVVPTPAQWLNPPLALNVSDHFNAGVSEQNAYFGVPLLALLIFVAVRWWPSRVVRWSSLMAAIVTLLSMGTHLEIGGYVTAIPLPWALLAELPVLNNVIIRRLMLYTFLFVAVLLAVFLDRLRDEARVRRLVGYGATALALLPLLPQSSYYAAVPRPVPTFFSSPSVNRIPDGSVALVAPFAARQQVYGGATIAMLWQAASGMRFRMPEGYIYVPPRAASDVALRPPNSPTQTEMLRVQEGHGLPALNAALRRQLTADLRQWAVQTVIVGPMPHQDQMLALFKWLFHREPDPRGGVYIWWGAARLL